MSHGPCAEFRAVLRSELPEAWQRQPSDEALQRMANQLGLERVQCHTVFLLPDLPVFINYSQWLVGHSQGSATVSVCVQQRDTWAATAPRGSLKRLLDSFRTSGCPDMGSLGCIYAPCQDGGSGGVSAADGARR